MSSQSTPAKLVNAAAELIAEQGAAHLTLSAVAERAGVSKGGLLYHFPNKRALLAGMLTQLLAKRENALLLASEGRINALLSHIIDLDLALEESDRHASQALLAVSAEQPDLLEPARDYLQKLVAAIEQHAQEPERALTTLLATEGLQLLETLGLIALSHQRREKLIAYLSESLADNAS